MKTHSESGMVLVVVMIFAAVASIGALGIMLQSSSHLKTASRQVNLEQSFYVAAGGAERAVTYIRNGGAVPGTLTGSIGNGTFAASVLAVDSYGGGTSGTHTANGAININPNNSPDNEFVLMSADGTIITRDDLTQDTFDYTNTAATLIHVKPKGNGNQNSLTLDGAIYTLENSTAYTFTAAGMNIVLWNDNRNPQGKAVGQWWISINNADGVALSEDTGTGTQATTQYSILSIGTVNGVRRAVILEGVHQQTWAKYALWYNHTAAAIWMNSGESFLGPVHANTTLYLSGNPVFYGLLTTTASGWGSGSDASGVTFVEGYQFNAASQTMASINFTNLRTAAEASGLVVTGPTVVAMSGTNFFLTNPKRGWTNYNYGAVNPAFLTTGLLYAATVAGFTGTVTVGGQLDGRVSIAADKDIWITNHITYAVHPTNGSDDAMGLIAQRDVVVKTNAPMNLNVFAHIIAKNPTNNFNAGFYVEQYDTRSRTVCSNLYVYGGIVEMNRGAVCTYGTPGTGYLKNYTYDTRYATDPPPFYPALSNEYVWSSWTDRSL